MKKDKQKTIIPLNKSQKAVVAKLYAHEKTVYYFALSKVKNKSDAEDITSETFERVMKCIDSVVDRDDKGQYYYLISTARSCIIDFFRHKNTETEYAASLEDNSLSNGQEIFANIEARDSGVFAAINKLPKTISVVVSLHYIIGLSVHEISKLQSIGESTIYKYLAAGRDYICNYLDEPELYKLMSKGKHKKSRKKTDEKKNDEALLADKDPLAVTEGK